VGCANEGAPAIVRTELIGREVGLQCVLWRSGGRRIVEEGTLAGS